MFVPSALTVETHTLILRPLIKLKKNLFIFIIIHIFMRIESQTTILQIRHHADDAAFRIIELLFPISRQLNATFRYSNAHFIHPVGCRL